MIEILIALEYNENLTDIDEYLKGKHNKSSLIKIKELVTSPN